MSARMGSRTPRPERERIFSFSFPTFWVSSFRTAGAGFWGADCYFWMQTYEEALRRYSALALRYQKQPEGLIALYQIWYCHHFYLREPEKAAGALGRLREAVKAVPEAAFNGTSPTHHRDYWDKKLAEANKPFAREWAESNFKDYRVDGVNVLISKKPTKLQAVIGNQTERAGSFSVAERDKLANGMIASGVANTILLIGCLFMPTAPPEPSPARRSGGRGAT